MRCVSLSATTSAVTVESTKLFPSRVTNPNRPAIPLDPIRSWYAGFPNAISSKDEKDIQPKTNDPMETLYKIGGPGGQTPGLARRLEMWSIISRTTCFSFMATFLGQDGLQLAHLIIEHALHTATLQIHLCSHLNLELMNLCCALSLVILNHSFQRLLTGYQ